MIEGLMNVMSPKTIGANVGDDSLEKVAMAVAAAIQRIIAEREELRTHVTNQQRELVALSAINEDLRRRIALIRHHYVELGTKILAQLEQFDDAFRETMRDSDSFPSPSANTTEHANLVALAERLRPVTSKPRPAERGD